MSKNTSKFSGITSLETFDESAFVANEHVSPDICNFVLTLACIYNDFKDTLLAFDYLEKGKPLGDFEENAEWGEFSGLRLHVIRIQVGLIHELLKLIEKSKKIIEDPFFDSVVRQVDRLGKDSWKTLVNIAQGNQDQNRIAKTLLLIRNKISFHYDPKELGKGYKKYFVDLVPKRKAYISRGESIKQERYYFADAASQNYFYSLYEDIGYDKFVENISAVMDSIAPALSQIITRFIQKRGYGWKQVN
jgi:hypothetical protein